MNATSIKFSPSEFNEQVCNFRELMGDKTFWDKPENVRQRAIDGLVHVYLNLGNDNGIALSPEELRISALSLDVTLTEYSRREGMMAMAIFEKLITR